MSYKNALNFELKTHIIHEKNNLARRLTTKMANLTLITTSQHVHANFSVETDPACFSLPLPPLPLLFSFIYSLGGWGNHKGFATLYWFCCQTLVVSPPPKCWAPWHGPSTTFPKTQIKTWFDPNRSSPNPQTTEPNRNLQNENCYQRPYSNFWGPKRSVTDIYILLGPRFVPSAPNFLPNCHQIFMITDT